MTASIPSIASTLSGMSLGGGIATGIGSILCFRLASCIFNETKHTSAVSFFIVPAMVGAALAITAASLISLGGVPVIAATWLSPNSSLLCIVMTNLAAEAITMVGSLGVIGFFSFCPLSDYVITFLMH
jgi:hypothetical protein